MFRVFLSAAACHVFGALLLAQTAPSNSQPNLTGSATLHDVVDYKPFTTRQKILRHTEDVFGPVPLLSVGLSAGFGQLINSPHEWGQGAEGFGARYGSAFGTNMVHEYIALGLETALHEDPRYFPSRDRTARGRLKNAFRQVYMAHKDDGTEGIAYARLGSALGAGMITNIWQPNSTNTVARGFERTAIIIGIDTGLNLAQEFIPFLRRINHH